MNNFLSESKQKIEINSKQEQICKYSLQIKGGIKKIQSKSFVNFDYI